MPVTTHKTGLEAEGNANENHCRRPCQMAASLASSGPLNSTSKSDPSGSRREPRAREGPPMALRARNRFQESDQFVPAVAVPSAELDELVDACHNGASIRCPCYHDRPTAAHFD